MLLEPCTPCPQSLDLRSMRVAGILQNRLFMLIRLISRSTRRDIGNVVTDKSLQDELTV